MATPNALRGDVWWVSFERAIGGEVRKTRPAVVLSNNLANAHLNRVVVVPLSTQTSRVYPAEAIVSVAGKKAKAMADQITTAAKERLHSRLGRLGTADISLIEDAVLLHLAIRRNP